MTISFGPFYDANRVMPVAHVWIGTCMSAHNTKLQAI